MKNWILFLALFAVSSSTGAAQEDPSTKQNINASKHYMELAEKVLKYQLGLEQELHKVTVESCKECDVEPEVCGFDYADVIALLETSLSNDPKNGDAAFLLGRVYWLKSYVGEGNYSHEFLLQAKSYLERARKNGVHQSRTKDLSYYLGDIEQALQGKFQARQCK